MMRMLRSAMLTALVGIAAQAIAQENADKPQKPDKPFRAGETLENLQAAYQGESNAHARYLAFAQKADEEGYAGAASLFRAAAKAEQIHAANHAEVIRKMGGSPKAEVESPKVGTTAENLKAALAGESFERDTMYTAYLKKARQERNRDAIRTFNFARTVEAQHATLYREALEHLDDWKPARTFYVCPTCGTTVVQRPDSKCPVCFTPGESFLEIK